MLRAIGEPRTLTPGQLGIASAALTETAERRLSQADACPACASWDEFCGPCRDSLEEASRLAEQARQLREEMALQCL